MLRHVCMLLKGLASFLDGFKSQERGAVLSHEPRPAYTVFQVLGAIIRRPTCKKEQAAYSLDKNSPAPCCLSFGL